MNDIIKLSKFTVLKRIEGNTFLVKCSLNAVRISENEDGTIN